ncbi:hypothetical protein GO755_35300 [Spirosoma sp. HMF4905]|uniref:Uncharacterized protein n=1 Tax=Spirosoma arboris TaxID=2682092 RepID=A0A7K1SNV9_9BACT|nr:hypothetical protein [Spirosoma arboris]MVM35343.1 hypothetical protein [Spirosoma arboris]
MDIQPPEDDSGSFDGINSRQIVIDWTEAVTDLYKNYRELSTYIYQSSNQNSQCNDDNNTYIGQCPVSQLIALVTTMQVELEKLLRDVSKEDNSRRSASLRHYKKLIDHTLRLDHLNQQAQSRLHLLSLSTS